METTAHNHPDSPDIASPRPRIKILATDLDDTLLREDLTISGANKQAIQDAMNAGVAVVPASGRVPEAMNHYVRELGLADRQGFMICGNGTIVIRTDTQEEILRCVLSENEMIRIYRFVIGKGFPVQIYHGPKAYTNREDPWAKKDFQLTGLEKVVVPEYEPFLRATRPVKLLIPGHPDAIRKLQQELREVFRNDFNIFTSKPYFLEILPPDSHKGAALRFVAGIMNASRSEVMAIGDSWNDREMLEYAGIGVAVANAAADIKQCADYVTAETNEEDAVARIIYRDILPAYNLPAYNSGTVSGTR
jgi:Cof subfamily protein (haloacid dehalogenase superfamily)